jgi:hypothetical protein
MEWKVTAQRDMYYLRASDYPITKIKTISATELARNLRRVLDRVVAEW